MFRKIALGVLVLLGTGLVLLAWRVVPGHLQIRAQNVQIPQAGELEAFFAAGNPDDYPVDIRYVNTASQSGGGVEISHPGVLIRWPGGHAFLIDAGMNRQQAVEFGEVLELVFGADPAEPHGPIEEQMGAHVGAIRGIGFTHLHSDHTGGISAICDALPAGASVFQTSQQAGLHNGLTREGQALIDESSCNKAVLGQDLVKPVPGFPGLAAIAAGGHTPGSTLFAASTGQGMWLFAGDITNTMADLRDNRGKGWVYSYLLVPENEGLLEQWRLWLGSLMRGQVARVVVAHDLESYGDAGLTPWQPPVNAGLEH